MHIIDTHCHIDLEVFDADRDTVLTECRQSGIQEIIVPGIESSSWNRLNQLCDSETQLYPAFGLHPVFINKHTENDLNALKQVLSNSRSIAVGEIGLDFFIKELNQATQIYYFEEQLKIAKEFELPVILHVRKAHDAVLKLLKKYNVIGGSCHAFSGSLQQAEHYIKLGFKLGFGGTLTYPNANKIKKLAQQIELDNIILETDAPDMSGFLHQGERNSPVYITEALQALADIKKESIENVAKQTTINARSIFKF